MTTHTLTVTRIDADHIDITPHPGALPEIVIGEWVTITATDGTTELIARRRATDAPHIGDTIDVHVRPITDP